MIKRLLYIFFRQLIEEHKRATERR